MKKYARLFSVIALILAITFIFSGCGVFDFAKSILIKDEPTSVPETTIPGEIIYTDDATNIAVVTPPSDTVSDTQATSTAATTATATTAPATTEGTTASCTNSNTTTTTAPVKDDITTADEIKEMLTL